jgi:tape measure domain-containing protein
MAVDLATLQIRIQALEVDAAKRKLDDLTRSGKKTESGLGGISRQAKGVDTSMGRLGKSVAGVVAKYVGIGAAVYTVQKLARASLDAAAAVERQQVTLGVLLGDAQLGADLFRELQDFSAATPLAIENLSSAAQKLMSFGVEADDVTDTLQMLGDASLGNSQKLDTLSRAYGRVMAKGKASMEEINMAMEAGLPIIAELAAEMGVTEEAVFDLASQGKVSADTFQAAFRSMTSEGGQFHDGMAQLAETFEGRLSTAMDNVKILGATLFAPALENAKNYLTTLTGIAQSLTAEIELRRLAREGRQAARNGGEVTSEQALAQAELTVRRQLEAAQQANLGFYNEEVDQLQARLDLIRRTSEEMDDQRLRTDDIVAQALAQRELAEDNLDVEEDITVELTRQQQIRQQMIQAVQDKVATAWAQTQQLAGIMGSGGFDSASVESQLYYANEIVSLYESLAQNRAFIDVKGGTIFGSAAQDQQFADLYEQALGILAANEGNQGSEGPGRPTLREYGPQTTGRSVATYRDDQGIKEYTEALEQQRATLHMNNQELVAYKLGVMGATDAEIEHAQAVQGSIDRQVVLHDALYEVGMMAGEVALSAFSDLGRAMYEASNAGAAMEAGLWSLLDSFIQMLPQLLLMAGIQLIAFGQWQIGLALIAASGVAAVGAGAWGAHKDATRDRIQGRASGGVVTRSTPYVVGEQGPEIFVPRVSGAIVANNAIGSGGGDANVTVQVINQAQGVQIERRERSTVSGRELQLFVKAITKEAIAKGDMDDVMSMRYGARNVGIAR